MRRVSRGELIVLPLKTTSQIALGTVKEGYKFRNDDDARKRHVISVDWQRTDVPRTAVKQDLLHSLGATQTVCQITRDDGAWRLRRVMETGEDPGARVEAVEAVEAEDADATDQQGQPLTSSGSDATRYRRLSLKNLLVTILRGSLPLSFLLKGSLLRKPLGALTAGSTSSPVKACWGLKVLV